MWKALPLSLLLCLALFLSLSLSFTLDSSPGCSRLIMPVLSPFSGMHKENCIDVLNEVCGQCWPQHQLTQLLITVLIGAADGESPCNPEYKRPAETCWCTRAHAHTLTAEIQKKSLWERICVHFKNLSFFTQLSSSVISNWPSVIVDPRPVWPS